MPYPVTVRGKRIWYAPWRRRPSLALMHADTIPMTGEQLAALGMVDIGPASAKVERGDHMQIGEA